MPRRKEAAASPKKSKLVDSVYLLLTGLGVVSLVLLGVFFYVENENAPWMPHGEISKSLLGTLFGFGFGIAYLYLAWDTRRLQQSLASKPHMKAFQGALSPWWTQLAVAGVGFAVGIYSLWLLLGSPRPMSGSSSAPIQILVGIALLVGGIPMLRPTLWARRQVRLTVSSVVFGIIVPAWFVVTGAIRLVSGCSRLLK